MVGSTGVGFSSLRCSREFFTEPQESHLQPKEGPNHGPILPRISYLWLSSGSGQEKGSFYRSKLKDQLLSSIKFESLYQFFFVVFILQEGSEDLGSWVTGSRLRQPGEASTAAPQSSVLVMVGEVSQSVEGKSIQDWNLFFLGPRGSLHPQEWNISNV